MTGKLLKVLPVFSREFHLTPTDFWALTAEEFDAYKAALQQKDHHG